MDISDFNITIVGLGLIGGSFAMALKKLKPKNLWGVDINPQNLELAEKLKIIDKGYIKAEEPLKKSDIVIIALYPKDTVSFIEGNINNFKINSILTDTAGIKMSIITQIGSFLPNEIDFIGGHPIAGKESKGITQASEDMFIDANYIFTPIAKNKTENVELLGKIAKEIGFKNIVYLSPEEHDNIIAYTSQLPHIIAASLICNEDIYKGIASFAGGSFISATRVADINAELWTELLISNKDNVIKSIEVFENSISFFKKTIESQDRDLLRSKLEESKNLKREGLGR